MRVLWLGSLVLGAVLWGGHGEAALNLMATRLIYEEGGEAGLLVRNGGAEPSLLQAWIDDGDERQGPAEVSTPFLVVPPMMRLGPDRGQSLRILGADLRQLPRDRESLFWLNVLGLPPKASTSAASVQLAYRTRIKLLYRPTGLQGTVADAVARLDWREQAGGLRVTNPAPFHISLSEVLLEAGGRRLRWQGAGLIPPRGTLQIPLSPAGMAGARGRLRWIDDDGNYREQGFELTRLGGDEDE